MKIIFGICIIFAVFASLEAADCVIDGHEFNVGETYTPIGHCVIHTCEDGGLSGKGCPSVAGPSECKVIKEDTTKPYPDCCPNVECP